MSLLPVNKKESLIYTFLMVIVMAGVMTTYNVVLHDGFTLGAMQKAWLLFPISFCIAFIVEWFFVSKTAFALIQKWVRPTDALPKKIIVSALCFVTQMVILMSVICSLLFSPWDENWWTELLVTIPRNFALAFPLQIFIAGPLVGTLFRKLFPIGTVTDPVN